MDSTSDQKQFLELIEQNKGIIYKIANAYCPDKADQQDLIQEMVLQLWSTYHHFDDRFKWSTWMYRVCLNVSISYATKINKQKISTRQLEEELLLVEQPEHFEFADDRLEQLHLIITRLKELDRGIVILYLEGKSNKEISLILGLSVSNVSTRMHRIKNYLKQQLSSLKR